MQTNTYVYAHHLREILNMFGLDDTSLMATRADICIQNWIHSYANSSQPWDILQRVWGLHEAHPSDYGLPVGMFGSTIVRNQRVRDILLEAIRVAEFDLLNPTTLKRLKRGEDLTDTEAHFRSLLLTLFASVDASQGNNLYMP